MKAVRWHAARDVRMDNVREPVLVTDTDAILAVEACGLCGTDFEEVADGPMAIPVGEPHPLTGEMAPITLGHEVLGHVVAAGDGAAVRVGQRVVPTPVINCGNCQQCLAGFDQRCSKLAVLGLSAAGGLAERVRVDGTRCAVVGADVPCERAVLVEPYSVALHAIKQADIRGNPAVAVIGLGTIGLAIGDLLSADGATSLIGVDVVERRREEALEAAFSTTLDPSQIEQPEADVVFEASGTEGGMASAVGVARPGGTIVAVGLNANPIVFPLQSFVFAELDIRGSIGERLAEVREAADLISVGKVSGQGIRLSEHSLAEAPGLLLEQRADNAPPKLLVRVA